MKPAPTAAWTDGPVRKRATANPSAAAAVWPEGRELVVRGVVEGHIATEARGDNGFGYDPIFVPEGETQTVAELGNAWKAEHSHRARAAHALVRALAKA